MTTGMENLLKNHVGEEIGVLLVGDTSAIWGILIEVGEGYIILHDSVSKMFNLENVSGVIFDD